MTEARKDGSCPFCLIATGEEPAHVVYEDGTSLAFLDRRPLFPGHCLLVPKEHYATLADLPEESVGPLFRAAKLLALAVEEAMEAEGTFVAVNNRVSQSVPHLHVHVVPRRRGDGLRGFFWPRQSYRDEAHLASVQAAIRAAVERHLREDRRPS
ncbi:MAG: HIT family protein [Firmicutes bacterium]|nr:HIT family protein [Bacillota bacterium]